METRSGDIDPGVMLELAKQHDYQTLSDLAYYGMGLFALSDEESSEMSVLLASHSHSDAAGFAVEYFCRQVRAAIGAFAAMAGGIDALVCSGSIGEHAPQIRQRICEPLRLLIRVRQQALADFAGRNGPDLVRLLFLDRSHRSLKSEVVSAELARDYCARQGGMTLLARRSGIDLRDAEEESAAETSPVGLPPKSALPFLITLELLLLEHAVLQHLYDRLSRHMPKSVDELITLKQEVTDSLEEYYGAITNATRFSDAVTADGETLLGVEDIYDAVMECLEAVSFAITTRS